MNIFPGALILILMLFCDVVYYVSQVIVEYTFFHV